MTFPTILIIVMFLKTLWFSLNLGLLLPISLYFKINQKLQLSIVTIYKLLSDE